MSYTNISIIGLGLIGGSIAKALKRKSPSLIIRAYDREDVCAKALSEKIIVESLTNYSEALSSDLIILCLPIEKSIEVFKELAPKLNSGCVLTDVCSVKGVFQKEWNGITSKGLYIGGHPMTGKESGGYENSDAYLFENAVYVISKNYAESPQASALISLVEMMGARVKFLDPFMHDKAAAFISHLPQTLAVSLVNSLPSDDGISYIDFAGGGFRDMTRIASSAFTIWESIYKYNKEEILGSIEQLQNILSAMSASLKEDKLVKLNEAFLKAAHTRDSIPKNTKGFLRPLYDIFVFVNDEPGAISKMSAILFARNINIKDIELLKIREGEGGAFRLGFSSKEEAENAKAALKENGITVT